MIVRKLGKNTKIRQYHEPLMKQYHEALMQQYHEALKKAKKQILNQRGTY